MSCLNLSIEHQKQFPHFLTLALSVFLCFGKPYVLPSPLYGTPEAAFPLPHTASLSLPTYGEARLGELDATRENHHLEEKGNLEYLGTLGEPIPQTHHTITTPRHFT